jgi:hypothetical protein
MDGPAEIRNVLRVFLFLLSSAFSRAGEIASRGKKKEKPKKLDHTVPF